MYSYQKSTAVKRNESFAPKRTSSLQLIDNRPESTIQRKLKNTTSKVIQLGINKDHKKKKKKKSPYDRPSFTTDSKKSAILYHNTFGKHNFKINLSKPNLTGVNAAQPHRLAWKDIALLTKKHHEGGDSSGFHRMTKSFLRAGTRRVSRIEKRLNRYKNAGYSKKLIDSTKKLLTRATNSHNNFVTALNNYLGNGSQSNMVAFLKQANSFHANVPDYGPHFGVNQPVSAAVHLNFRRSRTRKKTSSGRRGRSPSPMSRAILENLSKKDVSAGIAVNKKGRIISTSGKLIPLSSLSDKVKAHIAKFNTKQINSFDPKAPFGSKYVKK
ncbi:hypothetical protein [uncultured Kordia sp.]|uniref:hypothetical protein n=1 Tax=uncultured Kordia sp. TaxID=507699 RepID=UPI002602FF69|nr:hypothetical protein [uncultured Kordia sp.]